MNNFIKMAIPKKKFSPKIKELYFATNSNKIQNNSRKMNLNENFAAPKNTIHFGKKTRFNNISVKAKKRINKINCLKRYELKKNYRKLKDKVVEKKIANSNRPIFGILFGRKKHSIQKQLARASKIKMKNIVIKTYKSKIEKEALSIQIHTTSQERFGKFFIVVDFKKNGMPGIIQSIIKTNSGKISINQNFIKIKKNRISDKIHSISKILNIGHAKIYNLAHKGKSMFSENLHCQNPIKFNEISINEKAPKTRIIAKELLFIIFERQIFGHFFDLHAIQISVFFDKCSLIFKLRNFFVVLPSKDRIVSFLNLVLTLSFFYFFNCLKNLTIWNYNDCKIMQNWRILNTYLIEIIFPASFSSACFSVFLKALLNFYICEIMNVKFLQIKGNIKKTSFESPIRHFFELKTSKFSRNYLNYKKLLNLLFCKIFENFSTQKNKRTYVELKCIFL